MQIFSSVAATLVLASATSNAGVEIGELNPTLEPPESNVQNVEGGGEDESRCPTGRSERFLAALGIQRKSLRRALEFRIQTLQKTLRRRLMK
jgi:hypothetical protein